MRMFYAFLLILVGHSQEVRRAEAVNPDSVQVKRAEAVEVRRATPVIHEIPRAIPVQREGAIGNFTVEVPGADIYFRRAIEAKPAAEINPSTGKPYKSFSPDQLIRNRQQDPRDHCLGATGQNNFLNAIEAAVRDSTSGRKIETNEAIRGGLVWSEKRKQMVENDAYGLPPVDDQIPVSLASHPLCIQNQDDLKKLLAPHQTLDPATIRRLHNFSQASNEYRKGTLNGDIRAKNKFVNLWTQMMGCLAYAESYQSTLEPGTKWERLNNKWFAIGLGRYGAAFKSANPPMIVQPEGVQFGEDHGGFFYRDVARLIAQHNKQLANPLLTPAQKEIIDAEYAAAREKLEKGNPAWPDVGTYQFNPNGGNTGPCVDQWNKLMTRSECKILDSGPQGEANLAYALASHGQTFNTWCGVQKIVQSFNSQVHTRFATGTDNANVTNAAQGILAQPKDRCVSLAAVGGTRKIYSHFGPLGNSTENNFAELMLCVEAVSKIAP